jgi:hypothetical protein
MMPLWRSLARPLASDQALDRHAARAGVDDALEVGHYTRARPSDGTGPGPSPRDRTPEDAPRGPVGVANPPVPSERSWHINLA